MGTRRVLRLPTANVVDDPGIIPWPSAPTLAFIADCR